jgi:DNA-binding transcriptional regulator YiaG
MTGRTKPIIPKANHDLNDFAAAAAKARATQAKVRSNRRGAAGETRIADLAGAIAGRRVCTLAALRKARELTQVQLAGSLGIGQGDVSKLEQRSNVTLVTLARYVEATGGKLRLFAEYGNDCVELDLSDLPG